MVASTTDEPASKRRGWRVPDWAFTLLGFVIVAAIWQFVADVVVHTSLLFASFTATMVELWRLLSSGDILPHLALSGQEFLYGYLGAVVFGVALGAAFASSRSLNLVFRHVVQAGYATPLVAIAPLIIVLFGIGMISKVIVVFALATFPILIATQSALTSIDPDYRETAQAFGANRRQILQKVIFPAASLGVLTGLRLAVGRGIIGVVIGEFFGSRGGLGFLLVQYSMAFRTARTMSVVLLLAVIGVTANQILLMIEARLSPWRTSKPDGGTVR